MRRATREDLDSAGIAAFIRPWMISLLARPGEDAGAIPGSPFPRRLVFRTGMAPVQDLTFCRRGRDLRTLARRRSRVGQAARH